MAPGTLMIFRGDRRRRFPIVARELASLALVAAVISFMPLQWATALLGTAGLATVIAVRPTAGLAAIALLIPFGNTIPIPAPGVNGVDLLVLAVIAGWAAGQIATREIRFRRPPLAVALAVLVWMLALSLTQARSWSEGAAEWLKWVEFALLYGVATQLLRTRRQIGWVIGALLAAGMIQAALGAYQFWGQVGPPAFALAGGYLRAHGTFRQPNPYAGYLGYLAPVAASLAVAAFWRWGEGRRPRDLKAGLGYGAVALSLAAGIGMSWSRGGWMALVAAWTAVIGLRGRRTAAVILVLVGIGAAYIGLGGPLPGPIAGRLHDLGDYLIGPDPTRTEITDENFAVLERLAHWQVGLAMFADHPWLGVGIGNYAAAYPDYAPPHWYEPLGHAHNVFINFLAETGIAGLGAFVLFWAGAWRLCWQRARRNATGHPTMQALAIGVLGSLIYLTVHSIFDNLFVQHMQLQLALLLACVANTDRREVTC